MKLRLALTFMVLLSMMAQPALAKTIEIKVHGMTCSFCVDSLERKLTTIPSVTNVQVSLKTKKVRIETKGNTPTIEDIKRAIFDAGFTPVKIMVLNDEE